MCTNIKLAAAMERKSLQARVAIQDLNFIYGEIDQLPRWIEDRAGAGLLAEPSDRVEEALALIRQWVKVTKDDLQMRANNWTMQAASLRNAKTNNGGE